MTSEMSTIRIQIDRLVRNYSQIVQAAHNAERQLLEEYRSILDELVNRYAMTKPVPPKPLTIPTIFGQKHGENFLSDYLAYILNPRKNGIGVAPLGQLLSLCGIDNADVHLSEVVIHREYGLENGRIDLLLEWENAFVLGIENKILSSEGSEQTARYARAIRRQCGETPYHLVYLTRGGQKARSRAFQAISYAQLLNAFREVRISPDFSARRRVLWEDFLEHLEVYIIMSDPEHFEFSERAELYLEHMDMILDLESALKRDWDDAIAYIGRQVVSRLKGGPWIPRFDGTVRWQKVYKPTWQPSGASIHFEYFFCLDDLRQKSFSLEFHIEGRDKGDPLALFQQRHEQIRIACQEHGIECRLQDSSKTIARKQYTLSGGFDHVVEDFVTAFEEFQFLEKETDQVLDGWKQNHSPGPR